MIIKSSRVYKMGFWFCLLFGIYFSDISRRSIYQRNMITCQLNGHWKFDQSHLPLPNLYHDFAVFCRCSSSKWQHHDTHTVSAYKLLYFHNEATVRCVSVQLQTSRLHDNWLLCARGQCSVSIYLPDKCQVYPE